jgi:hypothetical protein
MVALESWDVLYNVELVTVNLNVATSGSVEVPFVIAADIDQSISLAESTTSALTTANTDQATTDSSDSASSSTSSISDLAVPDSSDSASGGSNE